jgi:hypothetical protein
MHHRMAVIGHSDVAQPHDVGGVGLLRGNRGDGMEMRLHGGARRPQPTAHQTKAHSATSATEASASLWAAPQLKIVSPRRAVCMAGYPLKFSVVIT